MTESFDARRERRKPRLVRGVSSVSKWWRSYLENGSFDGVELWVAPTQEGHEELRPNAILRATMDSMPALAPDLTVLAEPPVTSIAARFARRLGAAPRTLEFEHVQQSFPTRRLLVYLQGGELTEDVKSVLRKVSKNRYEKLVVYSAARAPETAAKWGILIGETQPKNAHLCFEADRVAEILDLKPTTKPVIDIAAIRKQLDLTQEELAAAIKVSSRTIQNWESGVGLSQLEKRASDLAELSDLLNDYLPRDQQAEWLRSSNEAFGDRAPIELLTAGRLRDLTIEFRRVQAGQPM